jgi:hypothetical protein
MKVVGLVVRGVSLFVQRRLLSSPSPTALRIK